MTLVNVPNLAAGSKILLQLRRRVSIADLGGVAQRGQASFREFGDQGSQADLNGPVAWATIVVLVLLFDEECLRLAVVTKRPTVSPLLACLRIRFAPPSNDPGLPSWRLVEEVDRAYHAELRVKLSTRVPCTPYLPDETDSSDASDDPDH